jgi:hypothetical protein
MCRRLLAFLPLAASLLIAPPKATHRPAKVLVKNIPFEADEHALLDKLAAFGAVQKLDLSKASKRNHGRPHNGWAWVYFASERSAWRACDSSRSRSLSLHGRALSVRLADGHHAAPTDRSQRKRSAAEEHPTAEDHSTSETAAEAAEQRSLVLERLRVATSLQEVESCVDALGELMTAEEYQVSKAAWKRALAAGVARVNLHGLGDHGLRRGARLANVTM